MAHRLSASSGQRHGEPHAERHEEERHGSQLEAGRGPHLFGIDPPQPERREEQDHAGMLPET